ncbi:WYL domain-containing protein [Wenzhouxiangella sp. XN24]|uniref:helix-turn-helix transcriptional regulator n=1 Tax=Wenzhouxiangella sp. XN24 TaxID=2713569 RepID=UPI0013EA4E3F|nr:WYL domain-containing protein [Wenzhouxiangella sp. XN24]NGX15013.1 WYL domain-containing protein [Wenzhouxiangella sp. XN24]
MDRSERFHKIIRMLKDRKVVSRDAFLAALEVSRATFKRDLEYLRDRMDAPILWDAEFGGYRLAAAGGAPQNYELPGLWLNAGELHALLAMEQLLDGLQPGLLGPHVRPLRDRIRRLIEVGDHSAEEVGRRIRVLEVGSRPVEPDCFQSLASAVLSRRRLRITHYSRVRGVSTERTVSPQRLVHYRDNWYLDAWCHERQALRTFSADAIESAEMLERGAREISDAKLDRHLGSGFGIFSGARTDLAVLQFTPDRARWVARESWHPEQEGQFQLDGSYLLKVPYSDPRELVMDIMKYGPDVEVLAPAALAELVLDRLAEAKGRYDARTTRR